MSTHIIIRQGLATLLKSNLIDLFANPSSTDEAAYLLQENFTFTPKEIALIFQNSYRCAFIAIGSGLLPLDKQRGWWQNVVNSSPPDEFLLCLEKLYLQPFAQQQGMTKVVLHRFRQVAIEECQILAQLILFKSHHQRLTIKEIAGFISETGGMKITDLILEQISQQSELAQPLMMFLRYEELLGYSLLFFLHEQLSQEARFQQTLLALQREGLMLDVREAKKIRQSIEEQFNRAVVAKQFGEVAQLALQLENLQQVESRMVSHAAQYADFIEFNQNFSHWAPVLQMELTLVLTALKRFGDLRSPGDKILGLLQQIIENTAISPLLKLSDELIEYDSSDLKLIEQAIQDWQQVPQTELLLSKIAGQLGCLVTAIHDFKLAEKLFLLAYQQAKRQDDRALSAINLFYLYIRQHIYDQALFYLQEAIRLNAPRYAPYYVQTYAVQRILSADGMGYVLLAQHRLKKKWVVIRCFWETFHDSLEALFQDAFLIAKVAGECVPVPLDCGFVDLIRQERGYLVTEYVESAIDGETWLQQYGKLDIKTGIAVGLQVAKCLQMAHQRGIFHLDLKPAHLLFKRRKTVMAAKTSVMAVKIMNFGLTRVAQPLTGNIRLDSRCIDWSLLVQSAVADLQDYASPEQLEMGDEAVDAKSDVYAFGRTWYRLLTGESPQNWQPTYLAAAPALFELLSDCVQSVPAERLAVTDLIGRLSAFLIDKRMWWEQLDAHWKKVFQRSVDINAEPNDSELEKLFNLSTLNCFNSEISELKPLSALTQLQTLNCNSNKISSLEPLRYLTRLQRLSCQNNQIGDLEPLCYLTHLQSLGIEKNQVSDLEPLRYLTNLQILSCETNQIRDLEPLRGLSKLQRLYCHNNQIRELEALSGLTKLHVLNCSGNQICELKPLFSLKQLQKLECGNNPLREGGLFRQSEVDKLQKALPYCRIIT
jgi:serine/threonine protein kinase